MNTKGNAKISKSVITRLPRYYRILGILQDKKIERISSGELSEILGLTASQIRQDFNCFGGFGQQGYGYNVAQLRVEIGNILGVNKLYKLILVGAGNLGTAVVSHLDFTKKGFKVCGIFDSDSSRFGEELAGLKILDFETIESFCADNTPTAAMLCIPANASKAVVERLIANGIKYFWNFSHYDINSNFPDVFSENVHLNDSLMTLCYNITNPEDF